MATNPISDPVRHLTAMMTQLVRQNQTLASHIDRLASGLADLSKDMRYGFRSVGNDIDGFRAEVNDRFRAVGSRFDELDERLGRVEDSLRDVRSDLLLFQNDILNAQQSALQAHLRLDEQGDDGEEPSS